MISVAEAKKTILEIQPVATPQLLSLVELSGLVLAEDVLSPLNLPLFDSSAMDGYAVRSGDTRFATETNPLFLKMTEKIWAGKSSQHAVVEGCCASIMTGAKMPFGADSVVMRENVKEEASGITVFSPVARGKNLRRAGEEIAVGEKILAAGEKIGAATVALLASCGKSCARVFPHPRISIIPTGSELKNPGEPITESQIYESNSFALRTALAQQGLAATVLPIVPDDVALLHQVLTKALNESTHVIVTGGVSVGDYDHNRAVLADCGVKEIFWKVAQKPGKPLYVGKKNETMVFGLPGNPASSLLCFYEYVLPALAKYSARSSSGMLVRQARLMSDYKKETGLTHFVRGHAVLSDTECSVELFTRQQSHMMTSFSKANCLVVVPAEATTLNSGSLVEIHMIPGKENT